MFKYLVAMMFFVSCTPTDSANKKNGASSVSAINMQMPGFQDLSPELRAKLNGMQLEVTGVGCTTDSNISEVGEIKSSISKSVKNGCDYNLYLALGHYDSTQQKLAESYYESVRGVDKVLKSDMEGKTSVSAKITLYRTDAGAKLGFPEKLVSSSGSSGSNIVGYDYTKYIKYTDVPTAPQCGNSSGSPTHMDVVTHRAERCETFDSIGTAAHEMNHLLVARADLDYWDKNRGADGVSSSSRYMGMYFLKGKAAIVLQPQTNQQNVKNLIPPAIRAATQGRYQTYLVGQVGDSGSSDVILNEWNAYYIGNKTSIDLVMHSEFDGSYTTEASMEFAFFACFYLMEVKKKEPDYLAKNDQFKAMYAAAYEQAFQVTEEMSIYQQLSPANSLKLRDMFRTHPENQSCRDFLKEYYGSDWTQRVMGF